MRRRTPRQFYRDACEYWREDLLLAAIFDGPRRFVRPSWWLKRIASYFLPKP